MSVTVTTKEGWGSRLGGSIRGVFVGAVVFVASFFLLFWNEGRAVKTARALDEGEGACISVESNKEVDPDYEGRLVHMSGRAETKDVVEDDVFGLKLNCIAVKREVEIFQWVEDAEEHEKKNLGGSVTRTTTYTYKQQWCRRAVDSSEFHEAGHENPPGEMEFEDADFYAENVAFGAFNLNASQIKMIGGETSYLFPTDFVCRVSRVQPAGKTLYVPNAETRKNPLNNRRVDAEPRPGDMRIRFKIVKPHDISIVAKQHGETFVSYVAKNGRKLNMLHDGVADAAEMFETARTSNSILTWVLRLVGFLLMMGGLRAIMKPISTFADVLPFLGSIIGIGLGAVAGLLAFVLTLVTIAVAWIFYRPVLGITLLVLAAVGIFMLLRKKSATAA